MCLLVGVRGGSVPAVLIARSMHPQWLSNAYLVAAGPGGAAVFVDSGAPLEPLHAEVERHDLRVTHLLTTHADPDHVAGDDELRERYGVEVVKGPLDLDGLRFEALRTPGHKDDHLTFVLDGGVAFTGDVLFRDAVGGGRDAATIRRSVMDVVMKLPPETRVLPGHTGETTIGREWEENPFVRVWRGVEPEGAERVRVGGRDATLVVWSPDYDGKGKALVRFDDGSESIVGGSRVERR
jgi:glyoxylase-like metal-dependent hydrolase (beta-lactamase superfamily II)